MMILTALPSTPTLGSGRLPAAAEIGEDILVLTLVMLI